MTRKIILNLAISLDGYISDDEGGFDWIVGDGSNSLDTLNTWDHAKFLEGIDVVVMGKKCYDQNLHEAFKDKKVFVATSKAMPDAGNIRIINGDVCKLILEEKQKPGKDIYLFGGGVLIDYFIKADIIDEYIVGIIPIILGKGRSLFLKDNPTIKLKLKNYSIADGVVILQYSKEI